MNSLQGGPGQLRIGGGDPLEAVGPGDRQLLEQLGQLPSMDVGALGVKAAVVGQAQVTSLQSALLTRENENVRKILDNF